MKEHPIIFSTEMVKAILASKKTMTRRIIKSHTAGGFIIGKADKALDDIPWFYGDREVIAIDEHERHVKNLFCPYGECDDLLWVRESFRYSGGYDKKPDHKVLDIDDFVYRADEEWNGPWRPSIHMPYTAARIWLKTKSVRVEKLQDISDGDVAREGVTWNEPLEINRDKRNCKSPAQRSFRSLWDKINGEESWLQNPWVWVIEFEVVSTKGRPA